METLAQTKFVVFDKTGTMTEGVFEVSKISAEQIEEAKLIEYAALVESYSSHPISKSLQKAYGKELDTSRVANVEEISGNGVTALVDGIAVAAGNEKLMDRLGIQVKDVQETGTIVHMAINGAYYLVKTYKKASVVLEIQDLMPL